MIRGPSHWITGADVVMAARGGLVLLVVAAGLLSAADLIAAPLGAIIAYALALLLLLGLPMVRSADIAGLGAIGLTLGEFAGSAFFHHSIDAMRLLYGMAALGAAILPMRAQRLRATALANPYRVLAGSERRGAGRTRAEKTTMADDGRGVVKTGYATTTAARTARADRRGARGGALPLLLPAPASVRLP
ncbi:hypothetical protein [Sphingomonas sp. PvP018]|uniref:hypothetical protein n=1 Tax=Sphingomonas sp. PvP018 TaxID=2817852 RepID=UPI001AE168D2|nr:hypothetical protein [Sphingomonas sp. PvP018]MBP2513867.1 hypothetical protein [Sphingomonas sp. PvP018]